MLMKTSMAIGAAVILVGIIILGAAVALWALTPPPTNTSLLGNGLYVVRAGDEISVGVPLAAGDTVSGTFTQVNGTTVYFYFMNSTQQGVFGNCAPCTTPAIVNASNPATYNFMATISSTGTYYFVFDNSNGNTKEAVTFNPVLVNTSQSPVIVFEALAVVGILVIIGGVVVAVRKR
jgi:hypothetical protein